MYSAASHQNMNCTAKRRSIPTKQHWVMQSSDLLWDECSVPAVHSEEQGVPPQDQTGCASGCVSWRTPRPGSDRCRGPEAGWPGPWTSLAGWGWGAERRAWDTQWGWHYYTPHTLRGHMKKKKKPVKENHHSRHKKLMWSNSVKTTEDGVTYRGCEGWMIQAREVPSHPSQSLHPHLHQNHLWSLWPPGDWSGRPPCLPWRGASWTQTAAPVCHFTKLKLTQLFGLLPIVLIFRLG